MEVDTQGPVVEGEYRKIVEEFPEPLIEKMVMYLKCLGLYARAEVHFEQQDILGEDVYLEMAQNFAKAGYTPKFARSVVATHSPQVDEETERARGLIMEEFRSSIFQENLEGKLPPVRGPFGEATIEIKAGCLPVKQRNFQVAGERRDAMVKIIQKLEEEGKIERGMGSWISPAFPVAKKNPGEYRLVIDYRKLNEATVMDAQPLPV